MTAAIQSKDLAGAFTPSADYTGDDVNHLFGEGNGNHANYLW